MNNFHFLDYFLNILLFLFSDYFLFDSSDYSIIIEDVEFIHLSICLFINVLFPLQSISF